MPNLARFKDPEGQSKPELLDEFSELKEKREQMQDAIEGIDARLEEITDELMRA